MKHFVDRKDTARTPPPRSSGRAARPSPGPTTDLVEPSAWPDGLSLDGLSNRAVQSLLRSGRPPFAPHGGAAPPPAHDVEDVLTRPGQPLELGVRRDLDQRFGHDFSHVRVHTDTNAASSARALGARAYTVGRDVVFGDGQYAPRSAQGSRLLAHELTHVVQQTRGGDVPAIDPHAAHERDADAAAAAAVTTHDAVSVRSATGVGVARSPLAPFESSTPELSLWTNQTPDLKSWSVERLQNTLDRIERWRAAQNSISTDTMVADQAAAQLRHALGIDPQPAPPASPAKQAIEAPTAVRGAPNQDEAELQQIDAQLKTSVISDAHRVALEQRRAELAPPGSVRVLLRSLVVLPPALDPKIVYGLMVAAPPAAAAFGQRLIESQVIAAYVRDKLDWIVTIAPQDVDGEIWYTFSVGGEALVSSQSDALPLPSLDSLAKESLKEVYRKTAVQSSQVVEAALLEAALPEVVEQIAGCFGVQSSPEDFALNEVLRHNNVVHEYVRRLEQLATNLDPANQWLAISIIARRNTVAPLLPMTIAAAQAASAFAEEHKIDKTAGEIYDEAAEDAGPVGKAGVWLGSTIGNIVTGGGQSLTAQNARLYRSGEISWSAYKSNERWNYARVGVVAVVGALTAGRASGPALGLLGIEGGTVAGGFIAGSAEGMVGGFISAYTSDQFAKFVAETTTSAGVRAFHEQTIGGPRSWFGSAAYGGMIGGPFGALVSKAKPRPGGAEPTGEGGTGETSTPDVEPIETSAVTEEPGASVPVEAPSPSTATIVQADTSGVVTSAVKHPPTVEYARGTIAADQPAAPKVSKGTSAVPERFPDLAENLPGHGVEPPLSEGTGPNQIFTSVSSFESIGAAVEAGIPDLVIGDGTVLTRADFGGSLPEAPSPVARPAPPRRGTIQELVNEGRPVSRSEVQNQEVRQDIAMLLEAPGADANSLRINQMQVIDDMRVATNRPDLSIEINGRRVHIEYDRAPGTRSMAHARRILTNDPDAIVILKIIDFD